MSVDKSGSCLTGGLFILLLFKELRRVRNESNPLLADTLDGFGQSVIHLDQPIGTVQHQSGCKLFASRKHTKAAVLRVAALVNDVLQLDCRPRRLEAGILAKLKND